ncbi:hypothetical protein PTTW11_00268 [Pyrenophora teres f. teres]|uniref:Uncharacterized protein n=1 Tax=Pyrenophora teres f. teres TaxID=97479 RepID=A0A6S6V590_9PLEO|nr:hypothetical protein PTTW11_00268 [Pyrenophora teres f. teres]
MMQGEQAQLSTTTFDSPTLVELEGSSYRRSMLYSVLPTLVSNHIPTIQSLRQSLNDVRNRGAHSKSNSVTDVPQPETPPPSYSSTPQSGSATPNRLAVALEEADLDFGDDVSERPISSSSALPPLFGAHEESTGIKWKYASLGTSLMAQATRESNAPSSSSDDSSTILIRQLYIHGITYLLRGLPARLTPEEQLSIQAALPQDLVDTCRNPDANALITMPCRSISSEQPPQNPTVLHRLTAAFVFQTFILIQFLLPYIKLLLSHTYQFERKHQITKRLVNTGVATADDIGRRTLRLSQTVCQMNDGMVGQALNEMTLWWVQSVTGGVQQGFMEGMKVVNSGESQRRGKAAEKMN